MRFRIRWAGLAFLVTLAAEIAVFIVIGNLIGYGLAILGILVLMGAGLVLVRNEGIRTWQRYRNVAAAGERPGPHLSRALVGLIASALLLVPGYVTSVIGLALFIPPVRSVAAKGMTVLAGRRLASSEMADLYGPRQVRVRTGRPTRNAPAESETVPVTNDTEPLEGEIIDPR